MPLESATATKKSSTKGRHIKQINPLAKGKSCLTCRQRKVRCTAERPACQACLRTARYEGRDVKTIQCTYEDSKVVRSRKGKGKGTAAAQGGSSTADEDEQTRKKNIKGTMADLLNGESGGEAAGLSMLPHPSRNNSWNSDWDPVEPAGGIRAFPPTHDYTSTPTLSYSSASSPSDTAVSCPPSPSTASMPIPSMQSLPSTSFSPYPFRLPPMYAQPPPAMTSTPLPYPTLPQPSIDYSSYFATLRPPTFDQLPIPPRQPSKPSPIPSPGARYLSESFNFPFDQSAPQPTPNFPSLYDRAPTLSNESSFSPYSLSYTPNPYVVQSPTTFGDMSSMFPSLTLPPIQVPLPTPAPVPDPSASLDPSQSQKAFGGSIASPIHHVQHHTQPVLDTQHSSEEHYEKIHPETKIKERHVATEEDKAMLASLNTARDSRTEGPSEKTIIDKGEQVHTNTSHHVHHLVQPIITRDTHEHHRTHTVMAIYQRTH